MASNPFHPKPDDLPSDLPIFPLAGVVLLPRAQLPLNVFEPRYLNLTVDALGAGRWIGMIQPQGAGATQALCPVGCAGRITAFSEAEDGRLLIVLTGVCRFRVGEERPPRRGYRRVTPDWAGFLEDLVCPDLSGLPAGRLLDAVRRYADAKGLEPDLDGLAKLPGESLLAALSMNLPLGPGEKQALLEARTPLIRAELLLALLDLAAPEAGAPAVVRH